MTRERTSPIFGFREMSLSLHIGFTLANAAVLCAILFSSDMMSCRLSFSNLYCRCWLDIIHHMPPLLRQVLPFSRCVDIHK